MNGIRDGHFRGKRALRREGHEHVASRPTKSASEMSYISDLRIRPPDAQHPSRDEPSRSRSDPIRPHVLAPASELRNLFGPF
jgi:hypothetical protein